MTQHIEEARKLDPEWRYEIQYGPEGEANYAWIYKGDLFVATMRTHHAVEIVKAIAALAAAEERGRIEERALVGKLTEDQHFSVSASMLEDGSPLVTDLIREFERARLQWDAFQRTGVSTAAIGSYDLCFHLVLKKHILHAQKSCAVPSSDAIDDLIERLLDAQQDINLSANETMSQPLCDASALISEVEKMLLLVRAAITKEPTP
jgi:hypothetical protein